jgi:L-fuconolactonase
MLRIDAHQHFWKYDATIHAWINDDMSIIKDDFYPADLFSLLQANNIDGCIAVQADQTEEETNFLLRLTETNNFIKGVVGWIDLCVTNIEERLQYYQQYDLLKGFRHILQSEEPDFMLQKNFVNGIGLLNQYGFTYDILIFPHHLNAALQLVKKFPDQLFVIDHAAKPLIKSKEIKEWNNGIEAIAKYKNVYCKISGMVTEADWMHWNENDFKPYLDIIVNSFGTNRIMFGSDWPVCLVASSYDRWLQTIERYFAFFSESEKQKIFGLNASDFYHLK